MGASTLLIIGFSFAADHGFANPMAYGTIAAGGAMLIVLFVHCLTTKRTAIIPKVHASQTTLTNAAIAQAPHDRLVPHRVILQFVHVHAGRLPPTAVLPGRELIRRRG
jgi:hypothetical protein